MVDCLAFKVLVSGAHPHTTNSTLLMSYSSIPLLLCMVVWPKPIIGSS